MTRDRSDELHRAIGARGSQDRELDELVDTAQLVEDALRFEAPAGGRQRALFTHGIAARRRGFPLLRFVVPAAVVLAGLAVLGGFGRTALPGDTLYPIREALARVGLAPPTTDEVERRVEAADAALATAKRLAVTAPGTARGLVLGALVDLHRASSLLDDLGQEAREEWRDEIADLEDEAVDILLALDETAPDEREGERRDADEESQDDVDRARERDRDDSSERGSGDDDDDDDNSGSGGDDDSDDDSGSGSDDDSDRSGSGDDDNSGSGSGDSDDDSGGGDDDDDEDSSGSGSGDDSRSLSGSGSGDPADGDGSSSGSGDDSDGSESDSGDDD